MYEEEKMRRPFGSVTDDRSSLWGCCRPGGMAVPAWGQDMRGKNLHSVSLGVKRWLERLLHVGRVTETGHYILWSSNEGRFGRAAGVRVVQ